jgi:hypothetical protein
VNPPELPSFYITLDGSPYQGEHSAVTRNKLKIGHPLDQPICVQGNRNLRSHIDRILTRMSEGQRITNIEITRCDPGAT